MGLGMFLLGTLIEKAAPTVVEATAKAAVGVTALAGGTQREVVKF